MAEAQSDVPVQVTSEREDESGFGVREISVGMSGGLVGMVGLLPLLGVAWFLGAIEPEAFASLATIVGLGPSFLIGSVIFIGGGIVTLPILFVSLAMFMPGRSVMEKGAIFGGIVWTGFIVAFFTGQTGLTLALYLVVTLVAHVAYGGILGTVYGRFAEIPEYQV